MKGFSLGHDWLTSQLLNELSRHGVPDLTLSNEALERVVLARRHVEKAAQSGAVHYGINTGFGYLSKVKIEPARLKELQLNIIRSHASGVGPSFEPQVIRGLLVLRAHTFCLGHSGITPETLTVISKFIENDILPVIPCQGSVGASGDLAPLAHLALGLLGEGDVIYGGERRQAAKVLAELGIQPIRPAEKEGLSLINGTHVMSVLSALAVCEARELLFAAAATACLSLDAVKGTTTAFDERIHGARHQSGQRQIAAFMRSLFEGGDEILQSHHECDRVQDAYSFRCTPQVLGASLDAVNYVAGVVDGELNSSTDNPLVFDGAILSGGNFHGEPLAMAMDFLKIAICEVGSLSERRLEKMTNPSNSGGPAFMAREPGIESGFMIPHTVAAALVSENKVLAHPASVDSISTNAEKEDHVSMGPIAARHARLVNRNVARVIAAELMCAAQGVDFHKPLNPSPRLSKLYDALRQHSPALTTDRSLSSEIEQVAEWLMEGGLRRVFAADHLPTLFTLKGDHDDTLSNDAGHDDDGMSA